MHFVRCSFAHVTFDRVWFVLSSSLSSHSIRTKSHAAVARRTFASPNVKKKPAQSNFCSSYVERLSKKSAPLWRQSHLQVKLRKTRHVQTTFWSFDVKKSHTTVARSSFASQNLKKLRGWDQLLQLRCRKISQLVSQSVNQAVSPSVSQVVNQSVSQLVSLWGNQSMN